MPPQLQSRAADSWPSGDEALAAPDTLRDRELGGTAPLPPLPVPARVATEPFNEPLRVVTEPLTMPARARVSVSYEVYTPDDTLRAKQALPRERDGTGRQRRLGLGALGFSLVLVTTLAGFAQCDDEASVGRVETTSASLPASRPAPSAAMATTPTTTTSTAAVVTLEPLTSAGVPPIPFSPPLAPASPAPRRRTQRKL